MKAKLMALFMAAGLGVTGIAMTAQAAETGTRAVNVCEHDYAKVRTYQGATDYNEMYHMLRYSVTYVCKHCGDEKEGEETEFELHDYENIYLDNGKMISICTGCNARIDG